MLLYPFILSLVMGHDSSVSPKWSLLLWFIERALLHYLCILKLYFSFTHFTPYMNGVIGGSSNSSPLLLQAVALSVIYRVNMVLVQLVTDCLLLGSSSPCVCSESAPWVLPVWLHQILKICTQKSEQEHS